MYGTRSRHRNDWLGYDLYSVSCKDHSATTTKNSNAVLSEMKTLLVNKITCEATDLSPETISLLLREQSPANRIDAVNWPSYPHRPEITFRIGHIENEIWISFDLNEKNPRGTVTQTNGPVYQDSCVEFFLSPRSDGHYYNIEINCIGTVLAGYGTGREDLTLLDPAVVSGIGVYSSLRNGSIPLAEENNISGWQITAKIPCHFFIHDNIESFSGLCSRGNFHSCADLAPKKRYLTWSKVETEKPDFHRYDYFGEILFT